MRQDGIICQDFWRWRLIIREDRVVGISFKPSTALDVSVGSYPFLGRFGASYSVIRNEVLIIGGIAKAGCIPKSYEILSISGSFSAVGEYETEPELKVACVEPMMPPDQPRPFLVGHTSIRTRKDQTLVVGGGAVCVSASISYGFVYSLYTVQSYYPYCTLSTPIRMIRGCYEALCHRCPSGRCPNRECSLRHMAMAC